MSEEILKALMQLFAIVSRPGSEASELRMKVESFLNRQLNQELVAQYLDIFDSFFRQVMEEDAKVSKKERLLSRRSVRVLKICTVINEALAQAQKIVVLVQLVEFIKSDELEATSQEMEFVSTVSETFNIQDNDFELISDFVISDDSLADHKDYLVVDGKKENGAGKHVKHTEHTRLICTKKLLECGTVYTRCRHINTDTIDGQ